jgi:hypothetical protein
VEAALWRAALQNQARLDAHHPQRYAWHALFARMCAVLGADAAFNELHLAFADERGVLADSALAAGAAIAADARAREERVAVLWGARVVCDALRSKVRSVRRARAAARARQPHAPAPCPLDAEGLSLLRPRRSRMQRASSRRANAAKSDTMTRISSTSFEQL